MILAAVIYSQIVIGEIGFGFLHMPPAQNAKIQQSDASRKVFHSIGIVRSKKAIVLIQLLRDLMHHGGLIERSANEENIFSHGYFAFYRGAVKVTKTDS